MSAPETNEVRAEREPNPADEFLRSTASGVLAGALTGGLVAGVLGRLAMRVLAAMSPEAVGGITDDRAVVGIVSLGGSLTLLAFGIGAGATQGVLYLLVRRALPRRVRLRVLGYGLFTGLVGGALFVKDHSSFDYSRLQPEWLAVTFFVLLPAFCGAATAAVIERAEASPGLARVPTMGLVAPAVVMSLFGLAILIVVPMAASGAVVALTRLRDTWERPWVTMAGRGLFLAVCGLAVLNLAMDIWSMATDTF